MRYLLAVFVILITLPSLAAGSSSLYLLTASDAQTLSGNFQVALNASPDRHAVDWVNRATGLHGSIVPLKTFRAANGQFCREYFGSLQLQSSEQQAYGTACRQAAGNWKVVAQSPVVRAQQTLKFVYIDQPVRQIGGNCPFNSEHSVSKDASRRDFQRWHQFQIKRFHEKYHNLPEGHPEIPPERQPEQQQPSKLIKLVAY